MKKVFQGFVERAVQQLSSDSRFCGLAVAGSWLSNEMEEFSDLDLVAVVNDADYPIGDRFEIVRKLGSHVSSFTGDHVGEPRMLICMFRDPLVHVDVKFVALNDFRDRIENPWIAWEVGGKLSKILRETSLHELKTDPQWLEDRIWTWVHYGAGKIARGEIFEAIGFLSFLREKVLGPLGLWVYEKPIRGVRRIEQYLPEFGQRLQRTIPSYSKESCFEALRACIEIYRDLRLRYSAESFLANEIAERESLAYLAKIDPELKK